MTDSRKTGSGSAVDDLERLQEILFGKEKDRLQKLDRRVSDLESRTADVAEVLTPAMNRLIDDPVSQSEFGQPIVSTIRSAIKRDTQSFAEALFPVLGPAIRRAVADALKGLVQRINVALENSFTIKGLRWRLEAARSGEPFAQIILRHTMLYAIQEVFLIQRKSGLVLSSVHRDESLVLDEDAVSAMLTAIQSFIQDSFGVGNDEPLRSAELGDRTLWVINGPEAVLACVISGTPPRSVRDELMDLLETMHARFGDRFNEHPEILAHNPGLGVLMQETLLEEADREGYGGRKPSFRLFWILAGLALAAFLAWSGWSAYQKSTMARQSAAAFAAEPGFVVTDQSFTNGNLMISGLRDPLARPASAVLEETEVPTDRVTFAFKPYQSLEPEIVTRQLRSSLGLGESTGLRLVGARLQVSGELGAAQYRELAALPNTHPVIRDVDLDAARLPGFEAVALIRDRLQAPDSVVLQPAGETVTVSGTAAAGWYEQAVASGAPMGGWTLDFTALTQALQAEMEQLVMGLDGARIRFARGSELSPGSAADLDALSAGLLELEQLAGVLGVSFALRVDGFADGVGDADRNREIAATRANTVVQELRLRGVNPSSLDAALGEWSSGPADRSLRKAELRVIRSTPQ